MPDECQSTARSSTTAAGDVLISFLLACHSGTGFHVQLAEREWKLIPSIIGRRGCESRGSAERNPSSQGSLGRTQWRSASEAEPFEHGPPTPTRTRSTRIRTQIEGIRYAGMPCQRAVVREDSPNGSDALFRSASVPFGESSRGPDSATSLNLYKHSAEGPFPMTIGVCALLPGLHTYGIPYHIVRYGVNRLNSVFKFSV